METRALGASGWAASAIGLGCMGMSDYYNYTPEDDPESVSTVSAALDAGVTLLDSGDFYGMGHNELIIRDGIKGRRREDFSISIKFGSLRNPWAGQFGTTGRPELVKTFIAYSLQRLGTDYIDFYFPSRPPRDVPIEDTIGAIADLIKEGKVRYLGVSEATADIVRRANAVHPVSALQIEYSIFSRDIERETLPVARELGIGILAYGALSRGLLTGAVTSTASLRPGDNRHRFPRFAEQNLPQNLKLVAGLRSLADEKGITLPQLCIAWVLAQGKDIVAVVGTKNRKRLAENLASANITLTADDLRRIDALVPTGAVAGTRYGEMSSLPQQ